MNLGLASTTDETFTRRLIMCNIWLTIRRVRRTGVRQWTSYAPVDTDINASLAYTCFIRLTNMKTSPHHRGTGVTYSPPAPLPLPPHHRSVKDQFIYKIWTCNFDGCRCILCCMLFTGLSDFRVTTHWLYMSCWFKRNSFLYNNLRQAHGGREGGRIWSGWLPPEYMICVVDISKIYSILFVIK